VVKDFRDVGDGRVVCKRHVPIVVFEEEKARELMREVRMEMERAFARFTTFPSTNVTVQLVNQVDMHQLLTSPGFDRQCPLIVGYTRSVRLNTGGWHHPIALLSAMPRSQLIGVYAHELSHAWVREHVKPERQLARVAEEGFCELVAYRVLQQMTQPEALGRLLRNNYTQGQIQLFLEADQAYDFQRVIDWMERGRTHYLLKDDPERFRDVKPVSSVLRKPVVPPAQGVRRGPEELVLRSVLGTGDRRVALVNDSALMPGDEVRVLVGTNRVAVRCLEVGANTVTLEKVEDGERIELRIKQAPDGPE
jgi:hypothetical protein